MNLEGKPQAQRQPARLLLHNPADHAARACDHQIKLQRLGKADALRRRRFVGRRHQQ